MMRSMLLMLLFNLDKCKNQAQLSGVGSKKSLSESLPKGMGVSTVGFCS